MIKRVVMLAGLLAAACGDPVEEAAANDAAPSPKAEAGTQMWATAERVQRRTCPSEKCGIVGQLFFREAATVLEERDGWGRVTEAYPASCVDGRSEYVDRGDSRCSAENGVSDGEFAEWVELDQLSSTRPPDPAATATVDEKLVSGSDDFARHRRAFVKAAGELIADGRCSRADFEEMGGWWKSTNHRDQPIYFTYCGGMTISNRLYLDAASGRVFQE